MDNLETGKDKIKKICEILKNETLEPAKKEALGIIETAQAEAEEIISRAQQKSDEMIKEASQKIEKEQQLFQTSLAQAGKQAIETLRQEILKNLFNQELSSFVEKATKDPKVAAELISQIVKAIEKEGTSADFSAIIPQSIAPEKVNALLASDILNKLREKSVVLGDFEGGVQLKLHDQKMTIDISDLALKELLGKYLRKDFRKLLFA